jgi:hypothetical protein
MIGINLNNNISCDHVCKVIQDLVQSYISKEGNLDNTILSINIVKTTEGFIKDKTLCIEAVDKIDPI